MSNYTRYERMARLQIRDTATVMLDNDGVMSGWFENHYPWLCNEEGWEQIPDAAHGEHGWYFYRRHGMSDEAFVKRLNEYAALGMFADQKPEPDLREALQRLKAAGVGLHAVTDRPAVAEADTAWWMNEYAPEVDSLTISRDKTVFMQYGPAPYFAIDDRVENVEKLTEAGVNAVLLDRPWNQHASFPRVYSLIEFAERVIATA